MYCAEDYMREVLGVDTTVTQVRSFIGGRSNFPRAVSLSSTAIEFYFSSAEVDRRKLHLKDFELTPVAVHEMIHSARELEFPRNYSIIERIASEGLAYVAQAYAEQDLFDIPYEKTNLNDNIDGNLVLEQLYNDPLSKKDISTGTHEELLKNDWLYTPNQEVFTWGQRLGIWCVQSMINEFGYDFPMLLSTPAEEIVAL